MPAQAKPVAKTEHSSTPESCFTSLAESLPTEQYQFKGSAALLSGQHSYSHEHCSAWALLHERDRVPMGKFLLSSQSCPCTTSTIRPIHCSLLSTRTRSRTRKIASAHTNLPDRDQTPHQTCSDTVLPANICSRDMA